MSVEATLHPFNDVTTSSTMSLQAVAHAAHLAAASAPLAVCAKGRHVTPAAVSEESAASAPYVFIMLRCVCNPFQVVVWKCFVFVVAYNKNDSTVNMLSWCNMLWYIRVHIRVTWQLKLVHRNECLCRIRKIWWLVQIVRCPKLVYLWPWVQEKWYHKMDGIAVW